MKDKIRPIGNRVLVSLDPIQQETESGLYIPKTEQATRVRKGTIIAVGPGRKTRENTVIEPEVDEGERVLVNPNKGVMLDEDEELVLMEEIDMYAVLEGES